MLALALALAACSSTTTTPGAPAKGSYEIDFPTIGAAIASNGLTIYVYDANDSSSQCVDLLENAGSGANLPAALQTISTSACGLSSDAGALSLPFGTYAVLVVATQSPGGAAPFLSGCAIQTITAVSPGVVVGIDVVNDTVTVPPAPPGCAGLQAYCQKRC